MSANLSPPTSVQLSGVWIHAVLAAFMAVVFIVVVLVAPFIMGPTQWAIVLVVYVVGNAAHLVSVAYNAQGITAQATTGAP